MGKGLELPGTLAELNAAVGDPAAVKAWTEAGRFGELIQHGIQLKVEEGQLEQWERLRAGGGVQRPNLGGGGQPEATGNPLSYSAAAVNAVQAGINSRTKLLVEADMSDDRWNTIRNTALTTGTLGAPREWAASVIPGPRILHVVAGVRQVPADAAEAEHAKLALPTATAASAEAATLAEYDSSTAGTVTLGRFGRFTDLSTESQIGTNAEAIIRMHQLGIAKDLDNSLIGKVETDAGTAVTFAADVPAQIRKAIAELVDNTAAPDPADIVILTHPDDSHLLEDVTPTGGRTIAESFQRFSGALVYPSAAVTTGLMTVANLAAGALFFEARGMLTELDADVKTGVRTVATSILGGYGTGAIGSYAIKQDVVTP